ncbi:YfhO family protein [candidate division WOR-3 bacterium]|nr:YfhO family protein [candidate division WOR-3 bacterium]
MGKKRKEKQKLSRHHKTAINKVSAHSILQKSTFLAWWQTGNKIAIGLLFILSFIFFAKFLRGTNMIYGSDWLLGGYVGEHWISSFIKSHWRFPMWQPYIYGGLPTIASAPGDCFYITNLLRLFIPGHLALVYGFIFHTFLAGLGMYLFLKELKLDIYSSFMAGVAYMFAGSLISTVYAGHLARLIAGAYLPFVLLFLHKGITTHRLPHFFFAGGFLGLSFLAGHFQKTYYCALVALCYVIFELVSRRKQNNLKLNLRLIGFSILGIVVTVGLCIGAYLLTYVGLSEGARGAITRGYKYAVSWSMPPFELLNLLVPDFSGILGNYWGENYFRLDNQYLGILPILLAGIALFYNRKSKSACQMSGRYVKFFGGAALVTGIFALGGHTIFYKIPYYLVPMLKKFRCPEQIFYTTVFSIIVLSGFGLNTILKGEVRLRRIVLGLSIISGIFFLFLLIVYFGKDSILLALKTHFQPVITQQKINVLYRNYSFFTKGFLKAFCLILVNSIIILLFCLKKIKVKFLILLAFPVLLFDSWNIQLKFLKSVSHPKKYYAQDEVVRFLSRDKSLYRVFPLHYKRSDDGLLMLYNIQSVGGHGPNPLARYQELIGAGESVMFHAPNLLENKKFLDLLNVKYIITMPLPEDITKYNKRTQNLIKYWKEYFSQFKLVYLTRGMAGGQGGYAIYENEFYLPRAFLVPDFELSSKEEVLNRIAHSDFDLRQTVILEESPEVRNQKSEVRSEKLERVKIIEYTPNKIICEVKLSSSGFLVLSENYHPDWKATVDGKPAKIYIANCTLRAIELPQGEHIIKFIYQSNYFKLGILISFLTFLFLLGTIGFWFKIQKNKFLQYPR